MNKKGYTLIELLVTITIIGIISLMSMPSVRRVQATNRTKKYESYSEAVEKAAKAYVDSYKEDIFKDEEVNPEEQICNKIKLTDLIDKKLIKNSNINDSTCTKEDTDSYVEVSKYQNKYYYKTLIKCKNKENNVVYKTPHYQKYDPTVCVSFLGVDETPPTLSIQLANKKRRFYSKNSLNNDDTTIKVNAVIRDSESGVGPGTHIVIITWEFIGVNNEGEDASMTIEKEEKIEVQEPSDDEAERIEKFVSPPITIPNEFKGKELNGTLKISIKPKPESVFDVDGNYTKNSNSHVNVKLDNNPPKLTVYAYKWKKTDGEDVLPTDGNYNGLEEYTNNKWYNGKVLTRVVVDDGDIENDDVVDYVSAIDTDSITYTTTGTTQNDENKKGTYRSIEAEGKSTITYRACDEAGNCINSNEFIVKLDRTSPVCTIPDDNNSDDYIDYSKWYQSLTTNAKCSDEPGKTGIDASGCVDKTQHKTFTIKANTYMNEEQSIATIYDKAGNSTECAKRRIKLDTIKPTCTKTSQQVVNGKTSTYSGSWTNKGEVVITGTCSDQNSGCEKTKYTSTYTTDINDYSLINVYDKAGNSTVCPKQLVRIDKTPPICTWNPYDITEGELLNSAATVFIPYSCKDVGNGSGCSTSSGDVGWSRPYCYWFVWTMIIGRITDSTLLELDEETTANYLPLKDNAGNETDCPRIRPYKESECTYTDGKLRGYLANSLRGNRYYIVPDVKYRPQVWTDLATLASWWDVSLEATSLDHAMGYRKYRKVGNSYELCLDISLDVMFDKKLLSSLTVVDELKTLKDDERPGIVTKTHQGKY